MRRSKFVFKPNINPNKAASDPVQKENQILNNDKTPDKSDEFDKTNPNVNLLNENDQIGTQEDKTVNLESSLIDQSLKLQDKHLNTCTNNLIQNTLASNESISDFQKTGDLVNQCNQIEILEKVDSSKASAPIKEVQNSTKAKIKSKVDYNSPLIEEDYVAINLTMKDLVYLNPKSNPMKSPVKPNTTNPPTSSANKSKDVDKDDKIKSGDTIEKSTSAARLSTDKIKSIAPQVKIGPDGDIILDTDSLYIPNPEQNEETFTKPAIQEEYDPFGYLKYSKKHTHHKIWTSEENVKFFKALSVHGINLAGIASEFHNRERSEIKNKFKREEKLNPNMIDIALEQHPKLEDFLKLLFPPKPSLVPTKSNEKLTSLIAQNFFKKVKICLKNLPVDDTKTKTKESIPDDVSVASDSSVFIENDEDDLANETEFENLFKPTKSGRTPKPSYKFITQPAKPNKIDPKTRNNARVRKIKEIEVNKTTPKKTKLSTKRKKDGRNNAIKILSSFTGEKSNEAFIPPFLLNSANLEEEIQEGLFDSRVSSPAYTNEYNECCVEETIVCNDIDQNQSAASVILLDQNNLESISPSQTQNLKFDLENSDSKGNDIFVLPQQYLIKDQVYQLFLVPQPSQIPS
ncbi:unnamed protein product [Gordionus sp. m RMFG-2023]|uniref:transcription factor TFIIIB component B'' homolog n=1 Tax=Gordionus sp. m RMFG-2023 TaxID=3053472 RepID=UPI0030E2447A